MIHNEYRQIFAALRENGVSFCQLRDDIEHGKLVDDLDLLVDSSKFDFAISILEGIGYRIKVTQRYLPGKSVLVKYSGGEFIVIDLHRSLIQDGFKLLDGDKILLRAVSRGPCVLPAESDLLLILLFHNIVGKREIQKKHQDLLRYLLDKLDAKAMRNALDSDALYDIILPVTLDPAMYFSNPSAVESVRKRIIAHLRKCDPLLLPRLVRRRIMALWRRYGPRPRAPFFALMGVDGVGKSSLTDALLGRLNQPRGFPAVTVYMGPWGHYQLRCMSGELFVPGWSVDTKNWLSTLFANRKSSDVSTSRSRRIVFKTIFGKSLNSEERALYEVLRTQSKILVTLRYLRSLVAATRFFMLLTAEMYYRYFLVYLKRRRGITVIADRYIYDLMTGRMHQMIPNYKKIRSLLCRVFPRPTRVFLLTNDAPTILARKADLSEAALTDFNQVYDQLTRQFGFETIRTNQSPEMLAHQFIAKHFDGIVQSVRT